MIHNKRFRPAPLPPDEEARLQALERFRLLDSVPEQDYDDIAALAAMLCRTPISLITLIDRQRQWFKSRVGLTPSETPRDLAFCAHAILGDELFEVADTHDDDRFAESPLVVGDPWIRFYAGVPLCLADGYRIGTVCVIDTVPRLLNPYQREALERLARITISKLEARRRQLDAEDQERLLGRTIEAIPDAVVGCDSDGRLSLFNAVARAWHGSDPRWESAEAWAARFDLFEADGSTPLAMENIPLRRAFKGEPVEAQEICIKARGQSPRSVLCSGGVFTNDAGERAGAVVVMRDITQQHAAERAIAAERQRLALIIDATRAGTWEWNVQTGEARYNERWAQMLGYRLNELLPLTIDTWKALCHPDDLPASTEALHKHCRGEAEFYDVVSRMRHRDGHWIWAHDRGRVVRRDEAGEPLLMAGTHLDITAMKRAELATAAARAHLQAVVDASLDVAIISSTPQGLITLFNPGAERLLGYSADELVGKQTPKIFHLPEEVEQRGKELASEFGIEASGFEVFVALARRGQCDTRQWTYVCKDGSHRQVRLSVSALVGEAGEPTGFLGMAVDLSSQLAAEEVARVNERQFSGAFASAAQGMGLVSLDGRWLEVNDAVCRILGYSREQLLQLDCQAVTHPEDRASDQAQMQKLLQEVIPNYQLLKRYLRKDGETVWALLNVSLVRDGRGRPLHLVVQIQDVSEQRKAEQLLRESAQYLDSLFDTLADGILSIDSEGAVAGSNSSLQTMLGYSDAELVSCRASELFSGESALVVDQWVAEFRCDSGLEDMGRRRELQAMHRSGQIFPVEIALSTPRRGGARHLVAVLRDLREQKRIEKLKNEFVSTVSHELRTPLTAISAALRLLTGRALGALSPQQAEVVDVSCRNSDRLAKLIDDLLDIEKLAAGKLNFNPQPHHLPDMLRDLSAQFFSYAARMGVQIQIEPPPLCWVLVDSLRFAQVMSNLLSNACKYSPQGTQVQVGAMLSDTHVQIWVSDQGAGIPDVFRPHVFEKFSQADASDSRGQPGTGLGLAICRELVERMDGQIGFESEVGQGTTFWFTVPRAAVPELQASTQVPAKSS